MNDLVPFEECQKEMAVAFGKETAAQFFGFLSDISRPPAKELGGLLADLMKLYRFKTQVWVIQKAKEHMDKLDIKPHKVPIKFIADFLDKCSWEEDEDMKERWAALLANSVSEGKQNHPYMSFVHILDELSPIEAKFIDLMYDEVIWPARRAYRTTPSYQSTSRLAKMMGISKEEVYVICDNLIRLNLMQTNFEFKPEKRDISRSKIQPTYDEVSLTYLGNEFIRNCRIAFSTVHAEEIERLLSDVIADFARNPKDEPLEPFLEKAKTIYPHFTIQDAKGAIYGALNHHLWKGGIIKDFEGYEITETEKKEIVKYCMDFIIKNNT
jgi:hypothetical protein